MAWEIWKSRCSVLFQKKQEPPQSLVSRVHSLGKLLGERYKNDGSGVEEVTVSWKCPGEGVLKLNVDGAVDQMGNQASAGGLFRDSRGDWVHGFWCNIGKSTADSAELWAFKEGLQIVRRRNLSSFVVESDSLRLVQAINKGVGETHPWKNLIQDCIQIMQRLGSVEVTHIFREANRCADSLAKLGKSASMGLYEASSPPPKLLPLMEQDRSSTSWVRCHAGSSSTM